jgi:LytS/YehU family sensor histidine kinase
MQKKDCKNAEISKAPMNLNGKACQGSNTYELLSVKVTLIAIFTALAIGSSYMLAPLVNVELMSVILFIAGFLYGKYIGVFVGLTSSLIYYGWNPFGVSPLPIYLICVVCMAFIGFVGGLLKPAPNQESKLKIKASNVAKIALIGFLYTFLFDITTNIVYGWIYYGGNILLAFITGFPFMIIHIISNTIIFALLVLPTYKAVTYW